MPTTFTDLAAPADDHGAPLLILHGWTGSKEDFTAVAAQLAEDRRVLVPDLPGHGGTPALGSAAAHGLGALAQWVLDFVDGSGVGDVHLLGHSHGGLVAQHVAARASQRLRSLVLTSTGVGALREERAEQVARIARAARDDGMEAAWEQVKAAGALGELADPRAASGRFVERRFVALDRQAVVGMAGNLLTAAPLRAFLRGIDVPVLVLHGTSDDAWDSTEQALLARSIRRARRARIPGARHNPQLEQPQAWLAAVRPFLADADMRVAA